jgi:hypothetical protein
MTAILEWFVKFAEQNPDATSISLGLLIAWAATFACEMIFFPEGWSQHRYAAWATGISMAVCGFWTYGFWRVLDPADGVKLALLAASSVAICAPFLYWALSKLISWKWPGLDLTFAIKPKEGPK